MGGGGSRHSSGDALERHVDCVPRAVGSHSMVQKGSDMSESMNKCECVKE